MKVDTHLAGKLARPLGDAQAEVLDMLGQYLRSSWNGNRNAVAATAMWRDLSLAVRIADLDYEFTVVIGRGLIEDVRPGRPDRPRLLWVMTAQTMQEIFRGETTLAMESIAGRIEIHGNDGDRRRLSAAVSYLSSPLTGAGVIDADR